MFSAVVVILRIAHKLRCFIFNSYLVSRFVAGRAGNSYGIGHLQKLKLTLRVIRNVRKVTALSSWQEHLQLVEEILRVPQSLEGVVVECGSYNGATTVNLSLACALTNRRLIVCDSFEGIPKPNNDEECNVFPERNEYYLWKQGDEASEGGLDSVKEVVGKLGSIEACDFVKGYFEDTLKDITADSIVLVFEDAVLRSSVAECLRWLWPKLQEGCIFYCHEPWSLHIVSLFYDRQWWQDNLKIDPPGFWGSGCGIKIGFRYSGIGYSQKYDAQKIIKYGTRLVHSGLEGFDH